MTEPTPDQIEPTQYSTASTTDTSGDNLVPPGTQEHEAPEQNAWVQIAEIAEFLTENFPDEISLSNRQQPETVAATTIRLLKALSSKAPPSQVERCTEPYCNRNVGHGGDHGWVHAG